MSNSVDDLNNQLTIALNSEKPVLALREAISPLLENGYSRENILSALDKCRQSFGDDSAKKEYILEVMDYLTGWCASNMRL